MKILKRVFELLPQENAELGFSFGKHDRVGLISAHPNGGWLVFGDFPSISNLGSLNSGGNFQKSLLRLQHQDLSSPLMTFTSDSPLGFQIFRYLIRRKFCYSGTSQVS